MWGVDVLRVENIKNLIEDEEFSDDEFSTTEATDETQGLKKNQLSRFDCIATFPLIMPDLNEAEKFKVTLPLLTGPVIKWETNPGTIIENHLFNDPFKLIVAIRIGTNPQGKSTILNQLMTSNSTFSSRSDPRAEYGIPHMIGGSVEFTWLTQETCRMSLWNDVLENYYKEGAKDIMLLANLHGDALDYPDQIKFLKQFPSSFLVFLMPGCTEHHIRDFEALIGPKKVVYGCVNNKNIIGKKKYTIDTNFLTQDKTLKKVRNMFKDALYTGTSSFRADELKLGRSLQFTEGIKFSLSQILIDFVKYKTCRYIKMNVMQFQRKQQLEDGLQIWKNNHELQTLMNLYKNILKLPFEKRRRALAHLEREVSRLSMIESSEARNQAVLKKEELRKSSLVSNQENEKKIRDEIAKIWADVDCMSLGLEHFFRELGQIYKIFSISDQSNEIVLKLPELYSELLIGGHIIELLDGDAGSISEAWFSAICGHICRKYPKLRIFVVSILGLQSSGKSTLLNALFACRFAVSVGRCTRGLFMRLLFLEKDLSDQLNIDALILIDTEGLGAPEKMCDPESEKKDRILATFAMGVSNLTILNVLGESMRDLTEILQIAIVTMARLEKAGMAPDILMVQHVSERNAARLSEPEEKFREALREALEIAEKQDIEMGISNTECLQILDERIKKGQLLKQFRPFKNGATAYAPPSEQYHEDVVNLYNSIINDCKNSQSKTEFSEWHSLIQNYWDAVSHEDFAVRFKNIKEIHDFIDLGKQITRLKETIDKAFSKHEESIMQIIRSKLQNWSSNNRSNINLRLKNECLELIEKGLRDVPCDSNCERCGKIKKERIDLEKYLEDKNNEKCEIETKQTIENYIKLNHQSVSAKLIQMLEASLIRKGISSESTDIINKHLETMLKNMPHRGFSDNERKQKVEIVWNLLRNHISSRNDAIPVEEKIDKEVEDEYINILPSELYQQYKSGNSPILPRCKAYKIYRSFDIRKMQISQYLEKRDFYVLRNRLDNLVDNILKRRASYHFYPGTVRDLKKEISQILNPNYLAEFKWNVHLYTLLKFKPKVISFQEEWDKENTPLGMLDQKKEEYLKVIDTRLQYGNTLVSEGHIVGEYLLKVIHEKAMNAGSEERKKAARDISWLNCAESVRLKYFERLAYQVQKGNKEEAIQHFSCPKYRIENWFISTVDNNTSGNPKQKYTGTFNAEFNRVFQEIRNCQSFEEIKKFVNNYMTEVDKVDYKFDLKDSQITEDLKILYKAIEEELRTKGGGRYPRQESFQKPNAWMDDTRIHHTSHQPEGLTGKGYKFSNELVAKSCHKWTDNCEWYEGDKLVKWSAIKTSHPDWKFDPHFIHFFNDLMCWFFEKLHGDIASKRDKKPASYDELIKNGCRNLDYHSIISTLKTKI
ncbi:hypothetical protein C1645_873356 [Glomus cerebriforme]|uniref:VLIG-type G domain-containing protein n=1 Tax=Glomus cerebriforme TaxID=658196 RepID=A0A397T8R3_9GLOM|nr:hypothetical protein C1645_873356 [Glomus cerebriforme]